MRRRWAGRALNRRPRPIGPQAPSSAAGHTQCVRLSRCSSRARVPDLGAEGRRPRVCRECMAWWPLRRWGPRCSEDHTDGPDGTLSWPEAAESPALDSGPV